jgi:arylsulfatase A-like enzyme
LADRPAIYRRLQGVWRSLEWEHFARAIASYYAFCTLIDDQVGRLLEALRATRQMENTLIVFVSDHGDYMGAHRLMLKGIPAFEQAYRVPLIMSGPGLPAGLLIDRRVSQIDLAASILPLLTGEDYDCQDHPCLGRSLLPLISAEWQGQPLNWESQHFAECHGQRFFYTQRVLWWQSYKYVFNGFDQDEFYNLADDPYEMENRAGSPQYRGVIEEMSARMWQVMHATGDYNMTEAEYAMFRFAPVGPQSGLSKTEAA